jgi:hypothetical protein
MAVPKWVTPDHNAHNKGSAKPRLQHKKAEFDEFVKLAPEVLVGIGHDAHLWLWLARSLIQVFEPVRLNHRRMCVK